MSAPPMGMISSKPKSKRQPDDRPEGKATVWATTNQTISATIRMPSRALSGCWPGKTSGAPDIRPCSLAKAMIEPVKVMAPIADAQAHLDQAAGDDRAGLADAIGAGCVKAAAATKTAARPTRLWKAATSCGRAVIWMR